jgi:hypothetical protein
VAKSKLRFESVSLRQIENLAARQAASIRGKRKPNVIVERPEDKRDPYPQPAVKRGTNEPAAKPAGERGARW